VIGRRGSNRRATPGDRGPLEHAEIVELIERVKSSESNDRAVWHREVARIPADPATVFRAGLEKMRDFAGLADGARRSVCAARDGTADVPPRPLDGWRDAEDRGGYFETTAAATSS
jgi:hypothetical protein